ncbi:single-stranded-DNA-specific exonuclease RecJ [Streptococcus criceti]|uniref:Single-stranded-DNA-specific exonuclease RecJ n=1 Tax=Streptococcus criceti HS-6 TaxID=873449 RepID=G5JR53_STRCG|nr:single-stranded-DNA-specific exonuclease RecJ [Streptococcus criceti]EHI75127.1 single-stranded-DNA-specific exonuclease RecJ [Streptococcus criceti HS-6]SUN42973.1 single-stranded-DNA-specific exonuclease RecJ [Streptococcus criceti]
MISSKFDWKQIDQAPSEPFLELAKKEDLDELAAQILYERGIDDEDKLHDFLSADLSQLHDPYLLHDMDKAVDRIRRAIESGERILIYGDYDADGMTSSSIMKEALEILGAENQVYLPNRFTDGYGPNLSVYKYFIEQQGISLIVTVDNGVAGHEAIAYAQKQGIDVIVTDHHSMSDSLPDAYAIVHPEHPAGDYPFKYLAGCGVAFKLATALLESIPNELLDLVAIGTIADMVSLTGENRILVKFGLQMLAQTERIGLQELMQVADIDPSDLNEETVGFKIAPMLNALGRLDDPNPAVELLTGFDDQEAHEIALMIQGKNEERKQIVQDIYDQALAMVDPNKPAQILAKEGWHPGVLGIVAGRILEAISQPVILLTIEDGQAKGSARSVEAINIFDALNPHREIFEAFGGHAGAAGMTLPVENVAQLSDVLCNYIFEKELDKAGKNSLIIDEELQLSELSLETIRSLEKLAPFGMDNKKPVFLLKDFKVLQSRIMGQSGAHLKLRVGQAGTEFDLVAFSQGHLAQEFAQAKNLELAVTLSVNKWNGNTSLQLMLVDARIQGVQLIDIRSKSAQLPAGVPSLQQVEEGTNKVQSPAVILLEIPDNPSQLKEAFKGQEFQTIYFKNQIKQAYYLTGYGTREQFAKLYKTIYQFPEFDVRHKLKDLAAYLNIPNLLLIKMIQIFEELDFVSVDNGIMTVNKTASKKEISDSQIYQNLVALVKYQELMALGTPQEIYDWLKAEDQD